MNPAPIADVLPSIRWPTPEENAQRLAEIQADERRRRAGTFALMCPPEMEETRRDWKAPTPRLPMVNWAAYDAVQRWQFGPRGLLLTGATGLGKTRAVWSLLRRLHVEEGRFVRFIGAVEFGTEAEMCMEVGRGAFARWVDSLCEPSVLVLDDLGQMRLVGSKDDWAKGQLFGLVDYRLNYRRPIIVTTNLDSETLTRDAGALRGDPFLRRLLQGCEIIKFGKEKATP